MLLNQNASRYAFSFFFYFFQFIKGVQFQSSFLYNNEQDFFSYSILLLSFFRFCIAEGGGW